MRICERAGVAATYPDVPTPAIDHVLWCLHRAEPALRRGDLERAGTSLGRDLCAYPGSFTDLHRMGIPRIFDALTYGDRLAVVAELAQLGLAADGPEPGMVTSFVVVGNLLEARTWAGARGITYRRIIGITAHGDPVRLRGLDTRALAIVHLHAGLIDAPVEKALAVLQRAGAAVLPPHWYPGGGFLADRRLRLRTG